MPEMRKFNERSAFNTHQASLQTVKCYGTALEKFDIVYLICRQLTPSLGCVSHMDASLHAQAILLRFDICAAVMQFQRFDLRSLRTDEMDLS